MRLVPLLAVTVACALGACQPAAGPEPVDAAGAPAVPTDAASSTQGDAEAFVRTLYTDMANDGPAPLAREGLWSAAAWADMERYQTVALEGFNADPLCNCQDPAGIVVRDLAVTSSGADRADAAVTMTQGDGQTSIVLNLLREGGTWRIDDITREGDPNFRADVTRWTEEAQAAG